VVQGKTYSGEGKSVAIGPGIDAKKRRGIAGRKKATREKRAAGGQIWKTSEILRAKKRDSCFLLRESRLLGRSNTVKRADKRT